MIIELWLVLSLLVGGVVLVRLADTWASPRSTGSPATPTVRGLPLLAMGLVIGVGMLMMVMLFQVVTPVTNSPALTLALVVAGPAVLATWRWRLGHRITFSVPGTAATIAAITALVAGLRAAHLVTWHGDSLFYAVVGRTLSNGSFDQATVSELFEKRLIGVPALHAVAGLQGELYVRSITALIAVAMLVMLVWLFARGVGAQVNRTTVVVFSVVALALLLTTNRVIYHVFYLNGHLLTGAMVLAAAGAGWLLTRRVPASPPIAHGPLVLLVLAAISTVVVTRAEGALTMMLVLAPVVLCADLTRRVRRLVLGWMGGTMAAWYAFGLWVSYARDEAFAFSTVAQFAAGLVLLASLPLVGSQKLDAHHTRALRWLEAGAWVGAVMLVVVSPAIAVDSISATVVNQLGAGKWGLTVGVVGMALIGVAALARVPDTVALRLPVSTFFPLVLLVAYLREAAYREGVYDSLNRMWMQILPLAVLYMMVAFTTGRWDPLWRRVRRRAKTPTADGATVPDAAQRERTARE